MVRGAHAAAKLAAIGVVLAMTAAGCSSAGLVGKSAYGGASLSVADITNIGDYTTERAHFRNKDYGHSAAFYKRAVELSPKTAEAYVGLGASYDRLRRFDLSDRVYASLYDLSGGTVQYYNNVGYSYMLRGKFNEAMTYFRKAEKLDPGNVIITNNLQLLANAAAKARA